MAIISFVFAAKPIYNQKLGEIMFTFKLTANGLVAFNQMKKLQISDNYTIEPKFCREE